jgi:hypothetical protein
MVHFYTKLFAYIWYVCFATYCVIQSSILKQNMYQSSILKQNMYQSSILKQIMTMTQIVSGFCKCITNGTSVFYFYNKWYIFTQNYLLTFGMHVLQTK